MTYLTRSASAKLTAVSAFLMITGLLLASPAQAADAGGGWVITPYPTGPATMQPVVAAQAQYNTTGATNQWRRLAVGQYQVIFTGLSQNANTRALFHTSAFGPANVQCVSVSNGNSGADMLATVNCISRATGAAVDARFSMTYRLVKPGAVSTSGADLGFVHTWGTIPSLPSTLWYSSSGTSAEFTRTAVGKYNVVFAGLYGALSPALLGTAQVTSTAPGVDCGVDRWFRLGTATTLYFSCYDRAGNPADAAAFASVSNASLAATFGSASWTYQSSATAFTSYTPASSSSTGVSTITRTGVGAYIVTGNSSGPTMMAVSAIGSSARCAIAGRDISTTSVSCVAPNGSAVDSAFNIAGGFAGTAYGTDPAMRDRVVSGINAAHIFDAGVGLICFVGAVNSNQLFCPIPASPNLWPSAGFVGNANYPTSIRSVAISNTDVGATTIYALGTDSILRSVTGDLSKPWSTNGNFSGAWTVSVQPTIWSTNAPVSIKKVIVIRPKGATPKLRALSTDGRILAPLGGQWTQTTDQNQLPAGTNIYDISHGIDDMYILTNDTRMFRSVSGAVTQLPALGLGLWPIAMGGPFVITNAGISSSGTYPCSTQKDAAGYYICDGTSLRVYMYQANGSWVPVSLTHSLGGNDNDVPSMGDPIASITPTIVDSRLEAGNSSDYLVWQYFSRMYHVFGQ